MAVKEWVKKFQPLPLYIILTLTTFYFLVQLCVSYITHALTLTVDSYLVLCNLIALFGFVFSVKYRDNEGINDNLNQSANGNGSCGNISVFNQNGAKSCSSNVLEQKIENNSTLKVSNTCTFPTSERRLKNTFGWARIDVLIMLSGCIFFASLCFAMVLEAIQTLFHISHHDEMHYPIPVFCVGAFGLLLNGLCYLLIGGYTYHQGNYLYINSSGMVMMDSVLSSSGDTRLDVRKNSACSKKSQTSNRQRPWQICRDAIGCIFVMICSAMVYYFSEDVIAKYVDPIMAIISALLLLSLSYPYMKESCLILLQTIPNHINIGNLCKQLMKKFPDIINVHDLHVWQLTADKTICTAHFIFLNPQVYARITKDITDFFHDQGITQITVQPEFFKDGNSVDLISGFGMGQCLVKCNDPECHIRYCCDMTGVSDQLYSVIGQNSQNCPDKIKQPTILKQSLAFKSSEISSGPEETSNSSDSEGSDKMYIAHMQNYKIVSIINEQAFKKNPDQKQDFSNCNKE